MKTKTLLITFASMLVLTLIDNVAVADRPIVEQFLIEARLDEGEKTLREKLSNEPDNHQLRFELGILQFFQTIENFGQSMYDYSPNRNLGMGIVPFLRFPVPYNKNAEEVTLKDIRQSLQKMIDDLDKVDKTLSKVDGDVKVPLRIYQFHLDFDGNGKAGKNEGIAPIIRRYLGDAGPRPNIARNPDGDAQLRETSLAFDNADVVWVRGYCCLLRAMCETILAYNQSLLWNAVGHRLFDKGVVKFDFLMEEEIENESFDRNYIVDFVAAIHNARFELKEPERLKRAHSHLLNMISHSRKMFEFISLETDNEGEWIPNPNQVNGITNAKVTEEMTSAWHDFLDEAEKILEGKTLVPFWRGTDPERGINLRKMFHEPDDIDVVLWIHGTGAIEYLESGKCTDEATWREFQRVFNGNTFGFAIWFN